DAFHDCAHRTTGDYTGSWCCWLHENLSCAMLADDSVWNRAAGHRNRDHAAASCLDGLADRFGNFVRLAGREADPPLTITDCYECVEGETTSALDDLGDAIDRDDVLDEIAATLATLAAASTVTSATGATSTTGATATTLAAALASATTTSATTSAAALSAASTLLAAAGARAAPGSASVAAGAATSGATACAAARGWRS